MRDLRDALRALRSAPIISLVAVLSLAFGIGASTAVFSLFDSLLLKRLPVRDPEDLVLLASRSTTEAIAVDYRVWQALRDARLFDQSFAWGTDSVTASHPDGTQRLEAIWATGDIFRVLGLAASRGRLFDAADDRRGGGPGGPVAVITHRFWRRWFGAAPSAIGSTLTIDGVRFTVAGVAPRDFLGLNVGTAADVILPLETEPLIGRTPPRLDAAFHWPWLRVMARRAPEQTLEALTAAVRTAREPIRQATMPAFERAEDRARYLADDWRIAGGGAGISRFRRDYGNALRILLAVVAVVLLIACANIATLLLGRAAARQFEFSVRLALGASRWRLARQLLIESLLLSAAGAVVGLAFAQWASRVIVSQLATWAYTVVFDLSVDWRVLCVTAGVTASAAVLSGCWSAWRATRAAASDALKRHAPPRAARIGVADGLVAAQLALSLLLVVTAGLFLRSFAALAYRDLGFDRTRVMVAVLHAPEGIVAPPDRAALYERVREAVTGVPGVENAALSMATPLGNAGVRYTPAITIPSRTDDEFRILANPVTPGWFATFGTRLLAGRDFDPHDRAGAPGVVIVNESFVRKYFGGLDPLQQTIIEVDGEGGRRPWMVIGVVENAAFTSVRDPIEPALYRPLAQAVDGADLTAFPSISLSVRARDERPALLTGALARAVGSVDASLGVSFQVVNEQLNAFYVRERLLALLSGFFGAFALMLAALGLYGLMADAVTRRRRELGIRMALGADKSSVLRIVLGRAARVTALGLAAGMLAAFWSVRIAGALLFAIGPRDPLAFGGAAGILTLVAIAAATLPALQAARTDPAAVLREP